MISAHIVFAEAIWDPPKYSSRKYYLKRFQMAFLYKIYLRIDAVALLDNRHSDVGQAWTAY